MEWRREKKMEFSIEMRVNEFCLKWFDFDLHSNECVCAKRKSPTADAMLSVRIIRWMFQLEILIQVRKNYVLIVHDDWCALFGCNASEIILISSTCHRFGCSFFFLLFFFPFRLCFDFLLVHYISHLYTECGHYRISIEWNPAIMTYEEHQQPANHHVVSLFLSLCVCTERGRALVRACTARKNN